MEEKCDEENITKSNGPELPASHAKQFVSYHIKEKGWWLVLSDLHMPYHDRDSIQLAVKEGLKFKPVGILLNGDILDCHELSKFDKDPSKARYTEEIALAKQFFLWLRWKFPKAEIVFKEGNHEERLTKYIIRRAPALFDLVKWADLLSLKIHDIKWVGENRVIKMNKLSVIHGHEYKPQIQVPVNPARGLFLRAKSSAMCGHWHQTSEHNETTITGKPQACWSTGCLCDLHPEYSPLNKWNHGFALINLIGKDEFEILNKRIVNGRVM